MIPRQQRYKPVTPPPRGQHHQERDPLPTCVVCGAPTRRSGPPQCFDCIELSDDAVRIDRWERAVQAEAKRLAEGGLPNPRHPFAREILAHAASLVDGPTCGAVSKLASPAPGRPLASSGIVSAPAPIPGPEVVRITLEALGLKTQGVKSGRRDRAPRGFASLDALALLSKRGPDPCRPVVKLRPRPAPVPTPADVCTA